MSEHLPKISVITPSYNQAQFLEQTILSVIGQQYPNLEYILMDGGSDDGSVDIIKKYEQHFTFWQSQRDGGQSAAINNGFARATGEILCWLNSDDLLMPGALLKIGRMFKEVKKPTIIFGNCLHFYEKSAKARGSNVVRDHQNLTLEITDYMIQPSSFWTMETWKKVGPVDEKCNFAMDWDWFIRAKRLGVEFVPIHDYLSMYRIHDTHKSGSGDSKRTNEIAGLYRKYTSEKLAKAFLKWDYIYTNRKFIHNIIYISNHYDIKIVRKIMHVFLFSSITFEEYKNITPR